MTAIMRGGDRFDGLIRTTVEVLGDAIYLADTATDEAGRREADEVHRRVREPLVRLAADNPGFLADLVLRLLEPLAKLPAEQIRIGTKIALRDLDWPELIPELWARRTT